ncbi:MAG: GIY-YIG nuclease family protein [Crocinitomicaceae bacterium]|nr:GIY-YIG nuclease family protein [Crocinitomicaceae bacterium]
MVFYVYILYSEKFDKYYIGQTNHLQARINRHNKGIVTYTKPYIPWVLAWSCEKATRSDAMTLEKKLKNLNRKRLTAFIEKYS